MRHMTAAGELTPLSVCLQRVSCAATLCLVHRTDARMIADRDGYDALLDAGFRLFQSHLA